MRYIIVSVGTDDTFVSVYGNVFGRAFTSEAVADELCEKLQDKFVDTTFFVSPIDEYPLDYFEMEEDDEALKMAW